MADVSNCLIFTIIGVFFTSLTFSVLEPIFSLWLAEKYGFNSLQSGLIYLSFTAAYCLSNVIAGYFSDKIRKKMLLSIGLIVGMSAYPIMALTYNTWQLVLASVFAGISVGISVTPTLSDVSEYLQYSNRVLAQAQAFALWNMAWAAGQSIGAVLAGILYEEAGFLNTMIIMSCVSGAYGACLAVYRYFVPDVVAVKQAHRRAFNANLSFDYPIYNGDNTSRGTSQDNRLAAVLSNNTGTRWT